MGKENVALFDMDNTLCDYQGAMKRDLELMRSPEETEEIDMNKPAPDWFVKRMSLIKKQPYWWYDLKPIRSGFDVLRMAYKIGFDCHVLTKGPDTKPTAWKEKVEWCQQHIHKVAEIPCKITITQDKGLFYGKILVDDYPDYIERWLKWRKRGLVIMPSYDYNEGFEHPNVIRYNGENLEEVQNALEKVYEREAGEELNL